MIQITEHRSIKIYAQPDFNIILSSVSRIYLRLALSVSVTRTFFAVCHFAMTVALRKSWLAIIWWINCRPAWRQIGSRPAKGHRHLWNRTNFPLVTRTDLSYSRQIGKCGRASINLMPWLDVTVPMMKIVRKSLWDSAYHQPLRRYSTRTLYSIL